MKNIGFATAITTGLAATVLGLAPAAAALVAQAPAALSSTTISAGIDHHSWLDDIRPDVNVPQVDTSVHQSR